MSRKWKLSVIVVWCLYYTKLAPTFKTKDNFTHHARGNLKPHHPLGERPASPSLQEQYTFHILITKRSRSCAWGPNPRLTSGVPSADTEKCSWQFRIWRAGEFLKKDRTFFGVPPSRSRAVAGLNLDSEKWKQFFGDLDFTFPRLISDLFGDFVRPQEGFGEECGRAFLFGFQLN